MNARERQSESHDAARFAAEWWDYISVFAWFMGVSVLFATLNWGKPTDDAWSRFKNAISLKDMAFATAFFAASLAAHHRADKLK